MAFYSPSRDPLVINRRRLIGFLGGTVAAGVISKSEALAYLQEDASKKTGVTAEEWNAETIRALAGTSTFDTAGDLHALVPESTEGTVQYWNVGPTEASPQITKDFYQQFLDTFALYYPNITLDNQNLDYNQMLDKMRTAAAGGAAPTWPRCRSSGASSSPPGRHASRSRWRVQLPADQFWPGAMKSVTWDGKLYGVPTNNETMALIWNKQIFADAGLDPESPPATWDDLVAYSKQIKDKTGKNGYGLVARVNAGNTPFRFMPVLWAYGGGALDEAEDEPTYQRDLHRQDGIGGAPGLLRHVCPRPVGADVGADEHPDREPGSLHRRQLAMMISHPSEYAAISTARRRRRATTRRSPTRSSPTWRYGLIPEGPVRRAVVFGGSNVHIFKPDVVARRARRPATRRRP